MAGNLFSGSFLYVAISTFSLGGGGYYQGYNKGYYYKEYHKGYYKVSKFGYAVG